MTRPRDIPEALAERIAEERADDREHPPHDEWATRRAEARYERWVYGE